MPAETIVQIQRRDGGYWTASAVRCTWRHYSDFSGLMGALDIMRYRILYQAAAQEPETWSAGNPTPTFMMPSDQRGAVRANAQEVPGPFAAPCGPANSRFAGYKVSMEERREGPNVAYTVRIGDWLPVHAKREAPQGALQIMAGEKVLWGAR